MSRHCLFILFFIWSSLIMAITNIRPLDTSFAHTSSAVGEDNNNLSVEPDIDYHFAIDDSLLLSVYPAVAIKPVGIRLQRNSLYSHTQKLHFTANNSQSSRFLIVVNSTLYNAIQTEIKRYAEDIHAIYGYEVFVESVSQATSLQLKSLILSYQYNLGGVLFVGDLSECMYEIEVDYAGTNSATGYRTWPCDLYYMDLDGVWTDSDNNGTYDQHTGDVAPDIFFGRLSAKGMAFLGDEVTLIKRQLQKSHDFWWIANYHDAQFSLNYIYRDWVNTFSSHYLSLIFEDHFVDHIGDVSGSYFSKSDYLGRFHYPYYGFTQLAAHSSPTSHAFQAQNEYIYISDIISNNYSTNCLGYHLFCCSACNWLAASSNCGYLGGAYLFNTGKTLVVVGTTKTGGMKNPNLFYDNLQTNHIGNSFRNWWRQALGNSNSTNTVSWFYGMTILGDPTINFRHKVSDVCSGNLVLSSFPSNNNSNMIMYKAEQSITVTNGFVIPSGVHVIFDAPSITFNQGFTCSLGGSFETRNEGCQL